MSTRPQSWSRWSTAGSGNSSFWRGRVDAVIETGNEVYVIEVKLDHAADEALAQIKEKGYADRYRASGRRITFLSIGFSSEKRDITDWRAEI